MSGARGSGDLQSCAHPQISFSLPSRPIEKPPDHEPFEWLPRLTRIPATRTMLLPCVEFRAGWLYTGRL